MTAAEIRAAIRAVKAEMKQNGIRKMSCFNGGHSPMSYRLNSRLFELNTLLMKVKQAKEQV